MKLVFEGVVTTGDSYRCSYDEEDGAIFIGGVDIVKEISSTTFSGNVIVGIADESFDGDLFVETGWGYSEYTPMDSDELCVGDHDLIKILLRYEGQHVTMYVSDEPINLLEE